MERERGAGEDKVCMNRQCVAISAFDIQIQDKGCSILQKIIYIAKVKKKKKKKKYSHLSL